MAGSALANFTAWLTSYGDAWEAGDADAAAALFTVGATLQPTPFDDLIRGRRLIHAHLVELFAGMHGVSFVAQVLGAGDTYGVAHWRVATADFALDGVLVAALDERGRCTSLRQWWHASPGVPAGR
jgi:SnoaL-like domain